QPGVSAANHGLVAVVGVNSQPLPSHPQSKTVARRGDPITGSSPNTNNYVPQVHRSLPGLSCTTNMSLAANASLLLEAQKLVHDLTITLLARFGAQVKRHLVDHFDAEVFEPAHPAISAYFRIDPPAQVIVHGRLE